jgi:hypothetical protein
MLDEGFWISEKLGGSEPLASFEQPDVNVLETQQFQ